jgi:Family of unknown function (DUF5829)
MKIRVLLIIIFIACFGQLIGQTGDSIKVDINHVFFCIDSVTYENLFKHEFISKVFADTRESSSKTLTDSWTGKYLLGRDSYIEVFASNSNKKTNAQLGDKFGDVGIVFKTKILGDINKIDRLIKTNKRNTQLKINEYESEGKIIPFNYNLYLSNADLQETFRPYVEEKTMEFLKICGFTESEIKSEITAEQFREKVRGKRFDKLYDNIEKIELILTDGEFEYLAETLKYFGFLQMGHRFTNNKLEIVCSVQQNRKYKLKAIHFTLLDKVEDINIEISKNLTLRASGVNASFQFNYQ